MAIKFEGGRAGTLRREFEERKEYKEYEGFQLFRTIDTHYVDFKYGMMNRNYEPITTMSDQGGAGLQNFPDIAENITVLPFVADAFLDMRADYLKKIEISTSPTLSFPKHIPNIIPARGYQDVSREYAGYINYNIEVHKKEFALDPEIKTYDIFVDKFCKVFLEKGEEFPITKSGFITSEHCSIMTSGLCIELAIKDYDLDEPKGEMITTSDFQCFADYANNYGFLIDKYVPWRLVADLSSEKMKEYIIKGRKLTTSRAIDLYESIYTSRSHYDDLYLTRNYLFTVYYTMQRNMPDRMHPIPAIPIEKHVETFFKIRCIELGIYDENFNILKDKVLDIYRQYGLRYAEGYIGQIASDRLRETYGPK